MADIVSAAGSNRREAILLSLPLVWGVRNVFRSGLRDALADRYRLIFAVPAEGLRSLMAEGVDESDIWTLPRMPETRGHTWALETLRGAHRRRHPTDSDAILGGWRSRTHGARQRLKRAALARLGGALSGPQSFRALQRLERSLFDRRAGAAFTSRLRQDTPKAALSTSFVIDWERGLFQALQRMGVPTLTHVLSFDNLTSRGYVPIAGYDEFLVWNKGMGDELQRNYDVTPARITVTGTPQFDFHVDPRLVASREETARRLGLDAARPYVVYCANHVGITPNEPALVGSVMQAAAADPALCAYDWVVRVHPLDRYARWMPLRDASPQLRLDLPWRREDAAAHWALPSVEEVAHLGNTLRHAAAVMTVASTIALDSSIVDTPVVGVGFHPSAGSAESRFYRDAHWSHHYRPISESGAAPVAGTLVELLQLLREAVTDRGARRAARRELVEQLCGPVDGHAANRIATAIDAAVLRGCPLGHRSAS